MTDSSKRKLLKALAAGGGIVTVTDRWTRPVVRRIFLPAHAATTGGIYGGDRILGSNVGGDARGTPSSTFCATDLGDAFLIQQRNTNGDAYREGTIPKDGGGTLPCVEVSTDCYCRDLDVTFLGFVDGNARFRFEGLSTGLNNPEPGGGQYTADLPPIQECPDFPPLNETCSVA